MTEDELRRVIAQLRAGADAQVLYAEIVRGTADQLEALLVERLQRPEERPCTCRPVTAAGVMVPHPHCAVHGTPRFTFNGKPLQKGTP